ncbi:hypothetical protein PENTCL1PPCAC_8804, partial [Pristionchus entomophagus]
SNEVPSNDKDTHANDDRNSTPLEKDSKDMKGEVRDPIEDEKEKEKDNSAHHTTNALENASDAGDLEKKRRPSRTPSNNVNYGESFDDSEPELKKPRIKSDKGVDN